MIGSKNLLEWVRLIEGLEHIGIAVKDLKKAKTLYRDILGLEVEKEEILEEMGIEVALFPVGGTKVELLQGLTGEDVISRFIEKKGEGFHHLAFQVKDIEDKLRQLEEKGIQLIDKTPRKGLGGKRIAFLHPRSTGGTLIELIQV